MSLREKVTLFVCAGFHPEMVGTLTNDFLALRLVERLCPVGGLFVDVGAHIGSVLAQVHHHIAQVRIIAIEADPTKAERLRRFFPYAQVHACAVGAQAGQVVFHIHPNNSACGSVYEQPGVTTQRITVPLRRLDDLLSGLSPDVVKMDIEGAELDALRAAPRLLTQARPLILLESGLTAHQPDGPSHLALHELLTAQGYALLAPNRLAHDDSGYSRPGWDEAHRYPRTSTNYFAVPAERRAHWRTQARRVLGIQGETQSATICPAQES